MNSTPTSLPSPLNSHRVHRWEAFTILMLILMDLSWITPTYSLLVGWSLGSSTATTFLVFGVIYLASSLVANIPKYVDIFIGIIQGALLTILLLSVIWAVSELIYFESQMTFAGIVSRYIINLISFSIPLKPELLLSIMVFLIWRRGLSLVRHRRT